VVLVIATAVGWYLYNTFAASTIGQPRLGVVSAELSTSSGELRLVLINPGPVDVKLSMVEVAGGAATPSCATQSGPAAAQGIIPVDAQAVCTATVGAAGVAGTMVTGKAILSGGQSLPFTTSVKP
jgi:type IV pilus assembly protein PilA